MAMKRRTLLSGLAAGALAAPSLLRAQGQRVLRFIPQSDVTALDPVWTSVYVTRNHAYLVFDTLFGQDDQFRVQPQMVQGAVTEQDGKVWRLTLRDGLVFHDGAPVLARDCVASIRRWARRDAFGGTLMGFTDELSAPDDKTILFRLKAPFPLLPEALGKVGINMLPIMPERLASTDPFKQVTEMTGSGPFRFVADERVVGARVVYAKFDKYVPRADGVTACTAGPKIAYFDRVEWNVIPDVSTAAAAMQRGEADWWEQPSFDLMPMIAKDLNLQTSIVEVTGNIGLMRLNQLYPPFDNPAIRRALLPALTQSDFMQAVAGDAPGAWRADVGYFAPGMPMASDTGLAQFTGPRDFERAKREVKAAGYGGEKVVVLSPSDYPRINALANVAADMLQKCGLNVDLQEMDWGTVIQRRANKNPPAQGGWNVFFTTFTGNDMSSPATNLALRGNGAAAWPGWPTAPKLEALRNEWLAATDEASQKRIAAEIQAQAFVDVPFLPLGQFFQPTVQSKTLTGGLKGMPLFWNIRRQA
jgi:peptide/nickel transport system substrate-binding protein